MAGGTTPGPLFDDLDTFIAEMSSAEATLPPGRERDLFSGALGRLRRARAGADVQLRHAFETMRSMIQGDLSHVRFLQQQVATARADLKSHADAAAARAAPAAQGAAELVTAAAFTVDTGLGERLREELLRAAGVPESDGLPSGPGQDLWENWK